MRTPQRHDWDLIQQYARRGSQSAFDEIVRRHIKLVYATCRRELADPWLAEDVTQVVFMILSKKARMLPPGTILSRWLFKTARFASQDVRKREARRKAREQQVRDREIHAAEITGRPSALDSALSSALGALGRGDWEAVQLRFHEDMSLKEIAERCGISEDAAQKRVSRAVERIRRSLAREGMAFTAVTIATLIGAETSRALPNAGWNLIDQASSVSAGVHSAALAGHSKIYGLTKGVLTAMALKNMATATVIIIGAAFAAAPIIVRGQGNTPSGAAARVETPSGGVTQMARPITVVIDPGHGGADSGAVSMSPVRVAEKDIDLAIALKLRDELAAKGAHVFLTRDSDVGPLVSARGRVGVMRRADFFISIHCDGISRETTTGSAVYYHAQNQSSRALAINVLSGVAKQSVLPVYGVKSDTIRFPMGFGVLREQPNNAVLVECGFMSNHLDIAALTDPEKQARIAKGIADGIMKTALSPMPVK